MKVAVNGKVVDIAVDDYVQPISQDYGELVETLIRRKYSLSAELSLHRQQFRKPEEFAEYNAYAEQCKAEAKEMLQRGKQ